MELSSYPITIDPWFLVSSLLPYVVHFIIAIIQGLIALNLVLWAKSILYPNFLFNLTIPKHRFFRNDWLQSKKGGTFFLILGILLTTPFLLDWHFFFSGLALVATILFCISSEWQVPFQQKLARVCLLSAAILTFSFMVWEKADPAEYSAYLCFKALKWRIEETNWQKEMDVHAPKVGQIAPDFQLLSTDGMDTFRLSDYKNQQPVALIFGSHTCPPHSDGTVIVNELYEKYQDNVAFINIYLSEAHPIDKWWLGESNTQKAIYQWTRAKARLDIFTPQNITERKENASTYRHILFEDKLPVFLDEMENKVSSLYAARPTRIYLIGKDGRVVFNPGFGPASFNVKHLGKAIENYLTKGVGNK